ncbi:unnamed protein product [Rhizoctonia solani]|uniref:Uncharacterized protein n=1 Tax=Rhizoctonia solani TaxID=456999 RepID=A0A8H3I293_9AGAM|nr:unnamed protein product [Rhizoctonia solani]
MSSIRDNYAPSKTVPTQSDSPEFQNEASLKAVDHWSNESARCTALGDYKAALDARQKAVEACRSCYKVHLESSELRLASELLELSKNLDCNGHIQEALIASQESRRLYEQILAPSFPSIVKESTSSPENVYNDSNNSRTPPRFRRTTQVNIFPYMFAFVASALISSLFS